MVKLLLVLVAAIGVVYGGLAAMGRRGPAAGPGEVNGPPPVRAVVQDYRRIENANRAAMERTMSNVAAPNVAEPR